MKLCAGAANYTTKVNLKHKIFSKENSLVILLLSPVLRQPEYQIFAPRNHQYILWTELHM